MANLSSSQFSGLSGPSDAELAGIESGAPEAESYGAFTADQVEGLRKMNERIDPAYARHRNKAGTAFSGSNRNASVGGAKRATAGDALTSIESAEGISGLGGLVSNKEVVSSDFDPADFRRSMSGTGLGGESPRSNAHYDEIRNTPAFGYGLILMKKAGMGRCKHPDCEQAMNRGMELTGLNVAPRQTGGLPGYESHLPPIPSVYTDTKVNGQMIRSYKVADPKHPEWQALLNQTKAGGELFSAEDFLEHHHPDWEPEPGSTPYPWDA